MNGKCYVGVTHYYESNERCGLLGISCYESSKSHVEEFTDSVCFELKTGKPC